MGQDAVGACEMDTSDIWSQHLEELGDRLNQQDSDRTGFLRMVNRNHLFNSSSYSLSSLFRYLVLNVLLRGLTSSEERCSQTEGRANKITGSWK
jgi:hypothetical protein